MKSCPGLNTSGSLLELLLNYKGVGPDRTILRHRSPSGQPRNVSVIDLADRALRYGAGLRDAGAEPGDRVAFLLTNSVDAVAFWFAVGAAGLVEVPVNSELRGPVLAHVLTDSAPRLVVTEPQFLQNIEECGYRAANGVLPWEDSARRHFASQLPIVPATPKSSDLAAILYTSGTTGPSKGVMLSHGYFANIGRFLRVVEPQISSDDVFYICTPMFHIDARLMMSAALIEHAVFSFAPRFSASTFWSDIRDLGASFFVFVGAMVSILAKTSSNDVVRATRLRSGIGGPTPAEAYEFFENGNGIRLMEGYGMTECNGVTWSTPDKRQRGSVGWESGPYEVRIAAESGDVLPPGETGEIIVRPGAPNLITMGYWKQQEATVAAFRDLWFHTGDLGRLDDEGFLWFLGRKKDAIRRRGENISAFEVENTLSQAPGVFECAAVPVPDQLGGEEEILLFVVPRPRSKLDPEDLITYAAAHLAGFAVPRYVRLVDSLPHTPTGKVEKHRLECVIDTSVYDRLSGQRRG